MNSRPKVSVVMSVYNGGSRLADTMDGILSQDAIEFEFVVVNDGSSDRSGRILKEYARGDPRIRLIHQEKQGLTKALIVGCAAVRGEFIARQDVGDRSLPGRFAKQVRLLAGNPDIAFVSCRYDLIGPKGEFLGTSPDVEALDTVAEQLRTLDATRLKGPHHGTVMFRKETYDRVGGYRPQFYYAQDLDLWTRLIEVGSLAYVPDVLYQVEASSGSVTALHRREQNLLRGLIAKAARLRRAGGDETEILHRAAKVIPAGKRPSFHRRSEGAYFIGSCLADQDDPRAARYFLEAVRSNPLHFKAWIKLAQAVATHKDVFGKS